MAKRRTVISELERRGAPELAALKVKRAILQAKGNFRALARVLQVKRMTAGRYVKRYQLEEYLREVRAIHSPHCAVKEWWRADVLEEVNRIRARHGLDPYFPLRSHVIRGGNKKDLPRP